MTGTQLRRDFGCDLRCAWSWPHRCWDLETPVGSSRISSRNTCKHGSYVNGKPPGFIEQVEHIIDHISIICENSLEHAWTCYCINSLLMPTLRLPLPISRVKSASSKSHWRRTEAPGLDLAKSDDLWAIHDLLLAGYAGIFMKSDSAGLLEAPWHPLCWSLGITIYELGIIGNP